MRKLITAIFFLFISIQAFSQTLNVLSIFVYNCDGSSNNNIGFNVVTNTSSLTYNWRITVNGVLKFSGSNIGTKEILVSGANVSLSDVIIVNIVGTGSYVGFNNSRSVPVNRIIAYTTPSLAPEITSASNQICDGIPVTIGLSGDPENTFTWYNSNTLIQSGSFLFLDVTLAGSYSVKESNRCGTSPISNFINLTTGTTPPAPIMSASSFIICKGDSIQLTANGLGGTYNWSNSTNGTTINVSKAGTYSVTETNSCGTSISSNILNINIDTLPVVNISSKIIGSKVELVGIGTLQYKWSSGELTAQIQKPLNLSGIYSVRGTDSLGCSTSKTFIVDAVPNAATTFITSTLGANFCTGDTTILTLTPGNAYYWDSGENTQSITTMKPGSHTGSVLYSSNYKVETADIYLKNYPVPSVNAINDSNSLTYCNNTVAPTIEFSGPITGTTFKWSSDNSYIGIQSTGIDKISSFQVSNNSNNVITINFSVIPTSNGCIGPAYNFKTIMNPTPYLTNEKVFNICDGAYFQLVPKINLSSTFNILWNVIKDDSTNLSNSPTSGSIISRLQNSSNNIKKIKFAGTVNSLGCANNDTLYVNVVPNPFGILNATKSIIKSGQLDSFSFTSPDTISKTYLWNLGFNIPLINSKNDNYTISYHSTSDTTNTIRLVVNNRYGCYNVFDKTIKIIGVADTIPMNSLDSIKWQNTLLPVPFNDHLSFRYHADKDQTATFSFFDTGGFPLYEIKVQLLKGYHQIEIPEIWRIQKDKIYLFICNSPTIYFQQLFYGVKN